MANVVVCWFVMSGDDESQGFGQCGLEVLLCFFDGHVGF